MAFRYGDALQLELGNLNTKYKKYWAMLREKRYKASELGINRRVLSHWRTTGIMDVYDDNPEQTKLSFSGLFWLQITNELRSFGVSLEKISNIKKQMFDDDTSFFEVYMFITLTREEVDVFMLVSPDGRAIVATKNELEISESFGLIEENYIKINFNIVRNKILKRKIDIIQQPFLKGYLSDSEMSILDLIRDGEYKEITLKFSNGIVTTISKKSLEINPDPIKEIVKMMKSNDDFCQINLVKQNGKIVVMEKNVMDKVLK